MLKKPKFWDYKKPNFVAYLFLPLTYLISLLNFLYKTKKIKPERIKTICVGNIYVGGTGKTPLALLLADEFKFLGKIL